jgi:hypothetical protein
VPLQGTRAPTEYVLKKYPALDGHFMMAFVDMNNNCYEKTQLVVCFVYTLNDLHRAQKLGSLRINDDLSRVAAGQPDICRLAKPGKPVRIVAALCAPPREFALSAHAFYEFEDMVAANVCRAMTIPECCAAHMDHIEPLQDAPGFELFHGTSLDLPNVTPGTFLASRREVSERYLFPRYSEHSTAYMYRFTVPPDTLVMDISNLYQSMCNTFHFSRAADLVWYLKRKGIITRLRAQGQVKALMLYYQTDMECISLDVMTPVTKDVYTRNVPGYVREPVRADGGEDDDDGTIE